MTDALTRHHSGLAAEDIAERAYEARGASILARRVLTEAGEIDLIAALGPLTIFAEVKARRTLHAAAHALSPGQSRRIMSAAECWLADNPRPGDLRFDLVTIDRAGTVDIIENALLF